MIGPATLKVLTSIELLDGNWTITVRSRGN